MRLVLYRPTTKVKIFFVAAFAVLFVHSVNFSLLFRVIKVDKNIENEGVSSVNLTYVVVHLDLKGAPPTLAYLESSLEKFKELGVNGLLIEYEDMFPYSGPLVNISTPFHYDVLTLKKFLKKAHFMGFEVIPLIQTFGHLEFVLKLERFAHLREVPIYPDTICPSKQESLELIQEMLTQVIVFHKNIAPLRHIHIGCDEVFELNHCETCSSLNVTRPDLFIRHVKTVTSIVKSVNRETNVLIWSDMLDQFLRKPISGSRTFYGIEAVYWDYRSVPLPPYANLHLIHKSFDNIWIATAFKGADGPEAAFPILEKRIQNHFNWLKIMEDYKFGGEKKVYNFKGIILTGWSRYKHFKPLCELLPVAMPSLISNLLIIQRFRKGLARKQNSEWMQFYKHNIMEDLEKQLQCKKTAKNSMIDFTTCQLDLTFPLYHILNSYIEFNAEIKGSQQLIDTTIFYPDAKEIESSYNWCRQKHLHSRHLLNRLKERMRRYFDSNVYTEYLGFKNYYSYRYLGQCMQVLSQYQHPITFARGRNITFYSTFTKV